MLQFTNSLKIVFAGLTCLIAASCLPSQASAQNIEAYLRRADLDNDGKIAPGEMRGPIKRYLASRGHDINETHQISDIVEGATGKKAETKAKETKAKAGAKAKSDLKVPKFGVDSKAKVSITTFGAAAEPIKYSEEVTTKARELIAQYDRNENGMLDDFEISRMPWGSPRPSASDKNGDGRLSFQEIQDRYRDREVAKQRSGESSSEADRGRGRWGNSSGRRGWFNRSEEGARSSRDSSRDARDDDDDDDDDRSASRGRLGSQSNANEDQRKREQAEKNVESYFRSRDLDKNGVIEGDEMKKVYSRARYDKNRDGKVTKAEVYAVMAPSSTNRITATKSSSNRSNSRYNKARSNPRPSSAFTKADKNEDQLVQMHEFSDTWTEKKLNEFTAKDNNGDGVISPEEW